MAGGTLLPFTLFAYAQSRVAAEVAGAFFNIEPLVGAVAGVVVFGNPAGPGQVVGGAAILAGIALSSLPLIGAGRPRAKRPGRQQATGRQPARTQLGAGVSCRTSRTPHPPRAAVPVPIPAPDGRPSPASIASVPARLGTPAARAQAHPRTLSAMWCVTPFTRDSGPLRVIPRSHRRSEPPIDTEHGYATGMGPHPDEVKITAPPGSVILFNASDLWHSGTFNYTPAARLAPHRALPGSHRAPGRSAVVSAAVRQRARPDRSAPRARGTGRAGRRDRACRCLVVGCTG